MRNSPDHGTVCVQSNLSSPRIRGNYLREPGLNAGLSLYIGYFRPYLSRLYLEIYMLAKGFSYPPAFDQNHLLPFTFEVPEKRREVCISGKETDCIVCIHEAYRIYSHLYVEIAFGNEHVIALSIAMNNPGICYGISRREYVPNLLYRLAEYPMLPESVFRSLNERQRAPARRVMAIIKSCIDTDMVREGFEFLQVNLDARIRRERTPVKVLTIIVKPSVYIREVYKRRDAGKRIRLQTKQLMNLGSFQAE